MSAVPAKTGGHRERRIALRFASSQVRSRFLPLLLHNMVNHRAARIRGQLKKELESFEDLDHELLPSQEKRFRDLVALMGQSAAGSSKASRRRRMRASKVLHAIGSNLGAEVLYLCTQSLSLTCLSELDEMDVVTMLSPWWSAKQCPLRLRRVAAHLWSTYKLDTYIQRNLGTEGGQVTRNHFDRVLQDISESVIENPAEIIEGGLSAENVSHSQTIGMNN